MKKVCLWGTSMKKPGDEAQVLAHIKLIKQKFPDCRIVLFSKSKALLKETSGYDDGSVKAVRTRNIPGVIRSLWRSDSLIFIGAPFYEEYIQTFVVLYLIGCAFLFRVKRRCFAITVFPFHTPWGKPIYRFIFNSMSAIMVRDSAAMKVLDQLGIRTSKVVVSDPRYMLDSPDESIIERILKEEKLNDGKPIIGFTTRYLSPDLPEWVKKSHGYSEENVKNINDTLAKIAASLADNAHIVVFPMHPRYADDEKMAEVIGSQIKGENPVKLLKNGYRSKEIMALMEKCEFIVAGRVGSTIFATAMGVPLLAIAYDDRMNAFMDAFGMSDFVFDWKKPDWVDVQMKLNNLKSGKQAIQEKIESKVKNLKQEIAEKFELCMSK